MPLVIDDTVPMPMRTAGPLPALIFAFFAAARVIHTVAMPLAARFEVTRRPMPLRSTLFRLCGSSCSCTLSDPGFDPPGAGVLFTG